VGELEGPEMKRWLFCSIALLCLAGVAATGTLYDVTASWFNPYHPGDAVPPDGHAFYTCYFKVFLDGVYQGYTTDNYYGPQGWSTEISATAGQTFSMQGQVMDTLGNLSEAIPVTITAIPASGPPAAQNQDPQVHPAQQSASVGEPVDAATGYLWYTQTLLREQGA
jgi:hypothetical protein